MGSQRWGTHPGTILGLLRSQMTDVRKGKNDRGRGRFIVQGPNSWFLQVDLFLAKDTNAGSRWWVIKEEPIKPKY